jgi:hypothetical protein
VKVIEQEAWSYTLFEDGSRLILSVMAGGAGMFEVPIVLNDDELATYRREGIAGLSGLISDIRTHPGNFEARRTALPTS